MGGAGRHPAGRTPCLATPSARTVWGDSGQREVRLDKFEMERIRRELSIAVRFGAARGGSGSTWKWCWAKGPGGPGTSTGSFGVTCALSGLAWFRPELGGMRREGRDSPPNPRGQHLVSHLGVFGGNEAPAHHIGVTCTLNGWGGRLAERARGRSLREAPRTRTHRRTFSEMGKARFGRLLSMPCPFAGNELSMDRARRGEFTCGTLHSRQLKINA